MAGPSWSLLHRTPRSRVADLMHYANGGYAGRGRRGKIARTVDSNALVGQAGKHMIPFALGVPLRGVSCSCDGHTHRSITPDSGVIRRTCRASSDELRARWRGAVAADALTRAADAITPLRIAPRQRCLSGCAQCLCAGKPACGEIIKMKQANGRGYVADARRAGGKSPLLRETSGRDRTERYSPHATSGSTGALSGT